MFPVQTLSKARPLIVGVVGNQTRNNYTNIVCTPPRNRVSLPEKMAHGFVIAVGVMATPLYIISNLKHYKAH